LRRGGYKATHKDFNNEFSAWKGWSRREKRIRAILAAKGIDTPEPLEEDYQEALQQLPKDLQRCRPSRPVNLPPDEDLAVIPEEEEEPKNPLKRKVSFEPLIRRGTPEWARLPEQEVPSEWIPGLPTKYPTTPAFTPFVPFFAEESQVETFRPRKGLDGWDPLTQTYRPNPNPNPGRVMKTTPSPHPLMDAYLSVGKKVPAPARVLFSDPNDFCKKCGNKAPYPNCVWCKKRV
jgi:hypothetical protein